MIINICEKDVDLIIEIEEKFPNVFLPNDIINDFKNNPYTRYLVYLIDDKVVGFINYLEIYNRVEIANFNVLEFFQNKQIGSKLMEKLIQNAIKNNIQNITLEVRDDNEKAIHVYKKYGFKKVAIRKKYYNDVDGILMEKELM